MGSPCTREVSRPGKFIRIVKVAGDIEACAGTHSGARGKSASSR